MFAPFEKTPEEVEDAVQLLLRHLVAVRLCDCGKSHRQELIGTQSAIDVLLWLTERDRTAEGFAELLVHIRRELVEMPTEERRRIESECAKLAMRAKREWN